MTNNLDFIIGFEAQDDALWQQHFYPDDIPEDWTLDFYSNEYPVMLLTEVVDNQSKYLQLLSAQIEQSFFDEFTLIVPEALTPFFSSIDYKDIEGLKLLSYNSFKSATELSTLKYSQLGDDFIFRVATGVDAHVEGRNELSPKELKDLYDSCVKITESVVEEKMQKQETEIRCYVLFPDSESTQKNADNFTMLSDML